MNKDKLHERMNHIQSQESVLGKYKLGTVVKIQPELNSYEGDFGHIVGFSTTLDGQVCLLVKTDQEDTIRYNVDAVELI